MKPSNGMLLEHLARYYFSTPYVYGRVLDIACGVGYGTQMIAKNCRLEATEIIGVDLDPASIRYAQSYYYHPMVTYQVEDALDPLLPEKLGQFDTIVSFETIEHVPDDRLFMKNIYDMLKPGGMLVLSSPFGRGRGMQTSEKFHVHQLTPEEFAELFVEFPFSEVEIYYQRGVTIEPPRKDVRYFIGVAVCKK
ncbi:class I SAM-dependent methyltransferase [Brevibacillus dissolubilis]|uniref:class I SAM-dependent methyltransferase n=1 Tax=Brevibacillus dissolubilis TaxID=1844116 RepID=UPI001115DB81|nr:class I SAM-dependent methyltransferase [Brevibacillus dissolubilis]